MCNDTFVAIATERKASGLRGSLIRANQMQDQVITSAEIKQHFTDFEIQVIGKDDQGDFHCGYSSVQDAKADGATGIAAAVYGRSNASDAGTMNPWYLLHECSTEQEAKRYESDLRQYI